MTIRTDQYLADATIRAVERPPLRAELAAASGVVGKGKLLFEWYKSTRVGRSMARVGSARGRLLAGGISYAAIFSIFAALTIGFTSFMLVLGRNVALRDQLVVTINKALPGIIDDGTSGLLRPEDLVLDTAFNPTAIIAVLVLLWSALAMMTALRSSIRAMFGVVVVPGRVVAQKARDLLGIAVMAGTFLVTSVLSIGANTLGATVFDWLGVEGPFTQFLLRAATVLVAAVVDFGVFAFLFRFFAGLNIPRRDLVMGAGLGALASGVVRYLGTTVIGAASDPVLASATALVTILVWVNLISRLTLMVAAFTANPPAPMVARPTSEGHSGETPNYVTLSVPATLEWEHRSATGTIEPDRSATGTIEPDRSLDPDRSLEPDRTGESGNAGREPRWGGLLGYVQRRRIEGLERRLAAARESYYR